MTKYYTSEKGKFGGTTGTILPFTIQLPLTNFPDTGAFKDLIPAGFLRCDGSILRAELYPGLARVIGVGNQCPFAKDELDDEFFQLPDLGSKYVTASLSSGEYLNDNIAQDPDSIINRVGAEVVVNSLVGDQVQISYGGFFEIVQKTIDFNGNPIFRSEDNLGNTRDSFLTEDNFQAHGHRANVGVYTYLGDWEDSAFFNTFERGDNAGRTEGSNELIQIEPPPTSTAAPSHNHSVNLPGTQELRDKSDFKFTVNTTPVDPQGLVTDVTLNTSNVQKLDNAVSPYMFMEYVIKI